MKIESAKSLSKLESFQEKPPKAAFPRVIIKCQRSIGWSFSQKKVPEWDLLTSWKFWQNHARFFFRAVEGVVLVVPFFVRVRLEREPSKLKHAIKNPMEARLAQKFSLIIIGRRKKVLLDGSVDDTVQENCFKTRYFNFLCVSHLLFY